MVSCVQSFCNHILKDDKLYKDNFQTKRLKYIHNILLLFNLQIPPLVVPFLKPTFQHHLLPKINPKVVKSRPPATFLSSFKCSPFFGVGKWTPHMSPFSRHSNYINRLITLPDNWQNNRVFLVAKSSFNSKSTIQPASDGGQLSAADGQ